MKNKKIKSKKPAPKKKAVKKVVAKKVVKKPAKLVKKAPAKKVSKVAPKKAQSKKVVKKEVKKSKPAKVAKTPAKKSKIVVKKAVKAAPKKAAKPAPKKAVKVPVKKAVKATKPAPKKAIKEVKKDKKIILSNTKVAGKVSEQKAKKTKAPKEEADTTLLIDKDVIIRNVMAKEKSAQKKTKHKYVRTSATIFMAPDEIEELLKSNKSSLSSESKNEQFSSKSKSKKILTAPKKVAMPAPKKQFKEASMNDILGITSSDSGSSSSKRVPPKWKKYHTLLLELLEEYESGVSNRASDVLKRSAKEDSGDLSSYGQHMADVGTESFERDMALSMLSKDKHIIQEIEAAMERIEDGTYGICEITGKAIPESRLLSVPYTRYTIEGQRKKEENDLRKLKMGSRQAIGEISAEAIPDEDAQ